MEGSDNRIIRGDAKVQKAIESLVSAFTILMSKEPGSGINMIALTLMIIEDQPFQNMLKNFREENPLHVKARDILVELRKLNAMPIHSAFTLLLIGRIKLALKAQKNPAQKNSANDNTKNKMGF